MDPNRKNHGKITYAAEYSDICMVCNRHITTHWILVDKHSKFMTQAYIWWGNKNRVEVCTDCYKNRRY